jgi:ketosteroid isomerase-like protein
MSKQAIDTARAEVNAGWLNSDADAIVAHATDDIKMLAPNAPRAVGKEAARAALNVVFSQFKTTKVEMADDRDVIISGDLAVEHWSYDFESAMVGGSEVFPDQGNLIAIWRRQPDGTWKESHVIWNSWTPVG